MAKLCVPHLLPGVEDHDIICGKIVLGHLPGYLLNLPGKEGNGGGGFSEATLMLMLWEHKGPFEALRLFDTFTFERLLTLSLIHFNYQEF